MLIEQVKIDTLYARAKAFCRTIVPKDLDYVRSTLFLSIGCRGAIVSDGFTSPGPSRPE
jgi:hypothetical protein